MFHQFTRVVKKRIKTALQYCFQSNAQYEHIADFIRDKYDFKERPQQGIVIQGASLTPLSLSADNFLGTLNSHIMYAHVDDHEGSFIEWIRENDRLLETVQGFPTSPGVYYLQLESLGVNPANSCEEFQFYVDPLLRVTAEPLIEFVTGLETSALLLTTPLLGGSLRLYMQSGHGLLSGSALTLSADQSLFVGGSSSHLRLGVPLGYVPAVAPAPLTGDYTFTSGVDDSFSLEVNGKSASLVFSAGTLTVAQVIAELRTAFDVAGIGRTEAPLEDVGGALQITGATSVEFVSDLVSPANAVFGFAQGFVPVSVTGLLAQPTVRAGSTFRVVVDGVEVEVSLTAAPQRPVADIVAELNLGVSATSLVVGTEDAGDYSLDAATGEVTFLHPFDQGVRISADYLYPEATRGPFFIGDGDFSNVDAIPGAVLAFGSSLKDGDVGAVVVTATREDVADVYGGKADVSLDFDIIARDAMSRSEVADLVVLYLFQRRRERLAEEGMALESVSMGGESEEPYDEVGDDYYYLANISIQLKADWEIHIERPLILRRVTPFTFEQDAQVASGQLSGRPDGFNVVTLEDLQGAVLIAGGDIERVR